MNVFELEAKIGLDPTEYESGLKKAKSGFSGLASGVMDGLKTVGKLSAAAVTATATGVAAISKLAISGYSEYEQLAGGVQKIFDKMDNSVIFQDADDAWKNLNMSTSEYMDTVIKAGANFASTMGDEKGYETAKRGIQAISDFASGTGGSIDNLSEKFAMITRSTSSYQSIADQFAGVLPATSDAFLEQAQAAGFLEGSYKKLTEVPLAEYQEALSLMLEKGVDVLGLTGNTAAETTKTISGSIAAMKAAWQNFLTGMADPSQDFGQLTQNLVSSVKNVGDNLIPKIKDMAPKLVEGFSQLASSALPYVSEVFTSLLPTVVEGATGLINSAVSLLPELLSTAVSAIPSLVEAAGSILSNLGNAIVEMLPILIDTGVAMLGELTNGIEEGLPDMISRIPQIITGFVGFINENLPNILTAGFDLLIALVDGIIEGIPDFMAQLPQIISSFVSFLVTNLPVIAEKGGELLGHLAMGLIGAIPELVAQVPEIYHKICETLDHGIEDLKAIGGSFLSGLWEGISSKVEWLGEKIGGVVDKIKGWFTGGEGFDVHSPSKWAEGVFSNVMAGAANGVEAGSAGISESAGNAFAVIAARMNDIVIAIGSQWTTLTNEMGNQFNAFSEVITTSDMWSNFSQNVSDLYDNVKTTMDNVVSAVNDMVEKCKKAMDFEWELPYMKMPHITVTGKFDIQNGTAPNFSVSWYNKAMNRAMLLDGATIFGAMGGKYLGGGESGREIVMGEDYFANALEKAIAKITRNDYQRKNASGITIVQNIQAVPQTPVELAALTQSYFEQARWAI